MPLLVYKGKMISIQGFGGINKFLVSGFEFGVGRPELGGRSNDDSGASMQKEHCAWAYSRLARRFLMDQSRDALHKGPRLNLAPAI